MKSKLPPIQLPIMAAVLVTLLAALWAGLIRLAGSGRLAAAAAFAARPADDLWLLGTLISLERAVALNLATFTNVGPSSAALAQFAGY
ncbi:MAG: hypothetical protein H6656_11935 [Ardenticatenaceae bacterium]|nr:hypothetical protein [Ardenticatenaceae bacterium]